MAWIADFPDPANFYYGILGCVGAVEGGWNWSKYCNKDLDARAAKADALVKADQQKERIAEWRAIFDDVMKDAPWAPVFNEKRFTYHSARLGGDPKLYTDPIHIPIHYDYIYAKDLQ
jgi:peptide/nickel transport system substrate-binding protein